CINTQFTPLLSILPSVLDFFNWYQSKVSKLLCLIAFRAKIMASNALGFLEGQAINRPPLLNGGNYPYWKCRMKIFLKSQNRLVWNVVEKGSFQDRRKKKRKNIMMKIGKS